ncbi:MAG TPA: hypothetical protein VF069_17800 [Streptosporangiaceae bacterium]
MTASYEDSRRYRASRDAVFHACCDAMQPCGFLVTASDARSGTIEAVSSDGQFAETESSSLMGLILKDVLAKFRERLSISVAADGLVHIHSESQPRTVIFDQGRNRANVIRIWRKLDQYLLPHQGVVTNIHNDSSVTITGNTAPVQQASPGAQQQSASPGATQVTGVLDDEEMDRVREFLRQFDAGAHLLRLAPEQSDEIRAEIATIRAQAGSPKPRHHIIRESLRSVRAILEQAGGGAVAVGLLELLHHINM